MEEIAAARKNCPVQVFATDIDEEALKFARLGVYPESIVADVEAGPPGEVLRPKGPGLSGQRSAAQVGGLRRAEPDYRSAVFQDGPHQLPQSADLPGRRYAGQADAAVQFRVESRRVSLSGQIGGDRRPQRPVRRGLEEGPALPPPCAGPPDRPGFADFAGPEESDPDRAAGRAQAAGGRLYGRDPAGPVEPLFRQRRVGGPEGADSSVPRPNRQVSQHADGRAQPEPAGHRQAGAVAETAVGHAQGDRGRQDGRAGERSGHAG